MPMPNWGHASSREKVIPACLHRASSFEMRHCVLAQYSWLCLCHFMDLGLSAFETPAYKTVLRQMATVAFTAVGHKKRFRLLTQHVLPSRQLIHTDMCKQASAMIIANTHCCHTV